MEHVFLNVSGLGDFCHAINVCLKQGVRSFSVVPSFAGLAKILAPDSHIDTNGNGRCVWLKNPTTLRCHLSDYVGLTGFDANLDADEKTFINVFPMSAIEIPKRPFILLFPQYTAFCRSMTPAVFSAIKTWCDENNVEILVCGSSDGIAINGVQVKPMMQYGISFEGCTNMVGKLSHHEILFLAHHALAFVGIDCGPMHLCSFSDTHGIWGFTSVNPKRRLPYRHGVLGWNTTTIVPKQGCKYCQEQRYYNHDYRNCMNGNNECIYNLDPQDFVDALTKVKGAKYDPGVSGKVS